MINYLLKVMEQNSGKEAIIWRDQAYTYQWLSQAIATWEEKVISADIPKNSVVALAADFSPVSVALFLALVKHACIIVPLSSAVLEKRQEFLTIAEAEHLISVDENDQVNISHLAQYPSHEILRSLKENGHPGLVLFSSGSTGKSKAAVHDLIPLLEKFTVPKQSKRILTFLLFDHIGGVNTLLYTLYNGGCVITLKSRNPEKVCAMIEKYRAEILPTSPTFLNLLIFSEAYRKYDLSSLETITYGTEVMQESTLLRLNELFPTVKLQQTYGLSELGILRSKSKSSNSLYVKIGGEGFETRVRDGLLEIKAKSAMLGYLNAPSPFSEDGWFMTGDAVMIDGEFMRILGRQSEIINVGGEKVYPAEVESVLQQMPGVEFAAVMSERNPITGSIVKAKIRLNQEENLSEFRLRMWQFCSDKLEAFKIPQRIELTDSDLYSARFKKVRLNG